MIIEPEHDKSNKMNCAPSEESDQPGHSTKSDQHLRWTLYGTHCFFVRAANTIIRLGGCPGWSESALGAQFILRTVHSVRSVAMQLNFLALWTFLTSIPFLHLVIQTFLWKIAMWITAQVAWSNHHRWCENHLQCNISNEFYYEYSKLIKRLWISRIYLKRTSQQEREGVMFLAFSAGIIEHVITMSGLY